MAELSYKYEITKLCKVMQVNRSGFYKWQRRVTCPHERDLKRTKDIGMFLTYHAAYPSHGYRWLNAKIRLDTGLLMSDKYAHKCFKYAEIRSKFKRYRYKKTGEEGRSYPNLVLQNLAITKPYEVIVSDMTAMYIQNVYHELTLYMDLYNNEIIGYALTNNRGNTKTYYEGLQMVLAKKKEYPHLETILHSDQGSVYSSKSYNELLPNYNITRSMSRVGTPTDNGAMEAIVGWVKEELFLDFQLNQSDNIIKTVYDYINYFNNERLACSLNYLTPVQFKERRLAKDN